MRTVSHSTSISMRSMVAPCFVQRATPRSTSSSCRCQQQQQQPLQQPADEQWPSMRRRDFMLAAPVMLLLSSTHVAMAEGSPSPGSIDSSSSSSSNSSPSPQLERFLDNNYELQVPSNYTFVETPIPRVERGPQPERSPVLARFEAPAGQPGSITVLARKAQAFKQTLLQVSDISQLGDVAAVSELVLPRGSTLLASTTQQVPQPPKETPLGQVDMPPQNYYIYEFVTNTGLHVAMAAAAKRGSVLIVGASTTAEQWAQAGPVFSKVVKSFRLRAKPSIS